MGMDHANLCNMRRMLGGDPEGKLSLLLDHAGRSGRRSPIPGILGTLRRPTGTSWRGVRGLLDQIQEHTIYKNDRGGPAAEAFCGEAADKIWRTAQNQMLTENLQILTQRGSALGSLWKDQSVAVEVFPGIAAGGGASEVAKVRMKWELSENPDISPACWTLIPL